VKKLNLLSFGEEAGEEDAELATLQVGPNVCSTQCPGPMCVELSVWARCVLNSVSASLEPVRLCAVTGREDDRF